MTITLDVPVQTYSLTNQRGHWGKKARQAKTQRTAVWAAWMASRQTGDLRILIAHADARATVLLTRIAPPHHHVDDDNLRGALKACRDQIAACFGVDDRDPRLVWVYAQEAGKPKEYAVRIEISTEAR